MIRYLGLQIIQHRRRRIWAVTDTRGEASDYRCYTKGRAETMCDWFNRNELHRYQACVIGSDTEREQGR
jgi:hypothetical protein